MRTMRVLFPGALLWLCAACGAGEMERAGTVVRDSAGVAIMENVGPAPARWRVSREPVLEIGVLDGEPAYELYGVRGARRLSDGTIAIANGGSHEVRFYDHDGRFLTAAGGRGGGPGEFQLLSGLLPFRGDSLLVWDTRQQRATIISPDGRYAREVNLAPMAAAGGPLLTVVGTLSDGTLLARSTVRVQPDSDGYKRDSLSFNLVPASAGEPMPVGTFPDLEVMERVTHGDGGMMLVEQRTLPYFRRTFAAARHDRVYVGTNDTYEVRVYGEGGELRQIVRRADVMPAPLTQADLEPFVRDRLDAARRAGQEPAEGLIRSQVLSMPRVPSLPAYTTLRLDDAGAVWVRDFVRPGDGAENAPHRWSVYDAEGRLTRVVETPPELEIHQIGRDFILGVVRDDFGVERVRLYRLDRD